jgi:hypothetical protein
MFPPATNEFQEVWRRIVARAWADPRFKEELVRHPNELLAQVGIESPPGTHFVVVENDANRVHLVLPAVPSEEAAPEEAGSEAVGHYHAPCW